MTDDELPTPESVLNTHEIIEEVYDMKYRGVRVAAPKLNLREILAEAARYEDVYLRAAYLLRKLITAHLFEDGNKRTAWVVTRDYLGQKGIEPAEREIVVERVLRRIRRYDVEEIAKWLETARIDRSRLR